jgi:hypothetical protein
MGVHGGLPETNRKEVWVKMATCKSTSKGEMLHTPYPMLKEPGVATISQHQKCTDLPFYTVKITFFIGISIFEFQKEFIL